MCGSADHYRFQNISTLSKLFLFLYVPVVSSLWAEEQAGQRSSQELQQDAAGGIIWSLDYIPIFGTWLALTTLWCYNFVTKFSRHLALQQSSSLLVWLFSSVTMTFRKLVFGFPPLSSNIQLALHHFPCTLSRSTAFPAIPPDCAWQRMTPWLDRVEAAGRWGRLPASFFLCQRCEQGQVCRWAPGGVLPPTLVPWWMSSGFTEEPIDDSWNAPPHCEIYCSSKIINIYFLL